MSEKDYKVIEKRVDEIDLTLLIVVVPESEIEDKLAVLARESGSVSRNFYEDFVISVCVANINKLLYAFNQYINLGTGFKMSDVRRKIYEFVLEANKLFSPEHIYINKNGVLKVDKTGKRELSADEISLSDNKMWELDNYEELLDPAPKCSEDCTCSEESCEEKESESKKIKRPVTDLVPVSNLKYENVKKWWNRLSKYVEIKQFKEEDVEHILRSGDFTSRSVFNSHIVSLCVRNVRDLFEFLDSIGISSKVSPPILMHELYDLCRQVNPFLTFEEAIGWIDDFSTKEKSDNKNKKKAGLSMSDYAKDSKQRKKFKDVPKKDLLTLKERINSNLVGQDEAIGSLVESIQRAGVGLRDPEKPIGSFLFAGSTGCGKTETCKILAKELTKDKEALVVIDCSEYSADHEYAKLIGCFVPGTQVLMADGSRKSSEEIRVGEEVITYLGHPKEVEFVHEYDQAGDMLEVTTVNSNIVETMTKTHEVLAIKSRKCTRKNREYVTCKPTCSSKDCSTKQFEEYKLEWVHAKELLVGDVVAYPRYKSTGEYPEVIDLADYIKGETRYKYDDEFIWAQKQMKLPRYIKVDENLTRLMGYYVSEGGSAGKAKTINFTFNSKEHSYIIEVVKLVRKVFGKEVHVRIKDRSPQKSVRLWVASKVIHNLFVTLCGKNTYVKRVPSWFKDMPDNLLKGFLETAVFGDGCQVIPRRMDYSTVSKDLHSQMELFFRRLGYITTTSIEKGINMGANNKDRYRLYIGGNQIEKLNSEFNFGIDLSEMELTNIQRMAWIDENYVYKQIKKIDIVSYTGKVYDLAVKDDTSYVLDFIVHNSPQGYVGYEQGGYLTNAVQKNPFSIVVFDEVEKASHKVHELLLQVLDEGRLTDGKGNQVSFKDSIIILTSNIGANEVANIKNTVGFGDVATITDKKKDIEIAKAIKKKFKPEFINRIDSIVYFKKLNKKDYMKIIDLELEKLNFYLKNSNSEYKDSILFFDGKIRNLIYKEGINEEYGARPLKRCIEKVIATPLAIKMLRDDVNATSKIKVTSDKNIAVFEIATIGDDPPFYLNVETKEQEIGSGH